MFLTPALPIAKSAPELGLDEQPSPLAAATDCWDTSGTDTSSDASRVYAAATPSPLRIHNVKSGQLSVPDVGPTHALEAHQATALARAPAAAHAGLSEDDDEDEDEDEDEDKIARVAAARARYLQEWQERVVTSRRDVEERQKMYNRQFIGNLVKVIFVLFLCVRLHFHALPPALHVMVEQSR